MKRYLSLYLTYVRLYLKARLQYRTDLLITIISTFIYDGVTLLFINIIFHNVPQLESWGYYEIIFIYGMLVIARGLSAVFLNMPWLLQNYIQRGLLDVVLVRPQHSLFQLLGQGCLEPTSFGRVLVGGAALVIAIRQLWDVAQPWWFIYIPITAISGAFLYFSVIMIFACSAFWFTSVRPLLFPIGWFSDFGQFPTVIYGLPIQFILTWVLPYAMLGFYPVAYMLRPDEYQFYGLLAPVMGVIFFSLTIYIWQFSIKRYQSTGS